MDLVDIGHGAELLGEVAEFRDRGDVAIHRIDRLEGDQLGPARIDGLQLAAQIVGIVMGEDDAVGAGMADALDHRGVVQRIRQHHAVGNAGGEGRERGPVRHVAGVEQQRRFLAVEIGKLLLQQHMVMIGAADIAGATGAGAAAIERAVHGSEHIGMLAHAEIIVRAPDGDVARAVRAVKGRARELADLTLEIGEDAVAALLAKSVQLLPEKRLVVHR